MVLGEGRELVVAAGLLQRLGELLQVDVTDPLEEHQREDVRLEVGLVDASAEQVGSLGEVLLQLGQRQLLGSALQILPPATNSVPSIDQVPLAAPDRAITNERLQPMCDRPGRIIVRREGGESAA